MRPHTSFVIGYHGCDRKLGMDFVAGVTPIRGNKRKYHWLGHGIYFWEGDQDRAQEWAVEKASRGEIDDPFVIGAVIELGLCLDLSARENAPLIQAAHASLSEYYAKAGDPMPVNTKAPKDDRDDKVMRYLDCAVINHLVDISSGKVDTVRGLFVEGDSLYDGGEIYHKSHVEIAVRNPDRIRGLFIPLP